jgi:hypothetical protein
MPNRFIVAFYILKSMSGMGIYGQFAESMWANSEKHDATERL